MSISPSIKLKRPLVLFQLNAPAWRYLGLFFLRFGGRIINPSPAASHPSSTRARIKVTCKLPLPRRAARPAPAGSVSPRGPS